MPATRILALIGLILIVGCSGGDVPSAKPGVSSATPPSTAAPSSQVHSDAPPARFITANPNPVHVEPGKNGTTTITWDSGDGSDVEIYLCPPDKPDIKFTGGPRGSKPAEWIVKGGRYTFKMYAGQEHKVTLGSVFVKTD